MTEKRILAKPIKVQANDTNDKSFNIKEFFEKRENLTIEEREDLLNFIREENKKIEYSNATCRQYNYRDCMHCSITENRMTNKSLARDICLLCKERKDTMTEYTLGQQLYYSEVLDEVYNSLKDKYSLLFMTLVDRQALGIYDTEHINIEEELITVCVIVKPNIKDLILNKPISYRPYIVDNSHRSRTRIIIYTIQELLEGIQSQNLFNYAFQVLYSTQYNYRWMNRYYNEDNEELLPQYSNANYIKLLSLFLDKLIDVEKVKENLHIETLNEIELDVIYQILKTGKLTLPMNNYQVHKGQHIAQDPDIYDNILKTNRGKLKALLENEEYYHFEYTQGVIDTTLNAIYDEILHESIPNIITNFLRR